MIVLCKAPYGGRHPAIPYVDEQCKRPRNVGDTGNRSWCTAMFHGKHMDSLVFAGDHYTRLELRWTHAAKWSCSDYSAYRVDPAHTSEKGLVRESLDLGPDG